MKKYKIAIVGGGSAGMMAAIAIGKTLNHDLEEIVLIEKTILGEKLLLTGGGKSNIANSEDIKEQLLKFNEDKNFLKHSFYSFTNNDLLAIFKNKGLKFKEEKNGKYFPINGDANSVLKILKEYLNELEIDIKLNSYVKSITKENNEFNIKIKDKKSISASNIILATGGKSYPKTGSTGDGYKIAENFRHTITSIKPGLVPLKINDIELRKLSGISLEDVEVSFKDDKNKVRGNILISHFGLSGPAILDLSNFYNNNTAILIDLIPNMSEIELNKKIVDDLSSKGKILVKNYLKIYLKNRFIDYFLKVIAIDGDKKLSNLSKKDRIKIVNNLKQLKINVDGVMSYEIAMITCGGIKTSEINPKTMESKLVPGLFFAGELLEPSGLTGGYNLQMAFSTGFLAGKSAAKPFK
ncbi:MAG: NAD(P)/FAD-dependent oxidoreductase [Methanobrevibacter sp.]|jgi:predicted Rossmann fold flavoprotein|nr:NAD(P)/FAD-dependent oxidoreductase [Candidatus Methanovirga meridionalis]